MTLGALTSMRFVAAFAVLLSHLAFLKVSDSPLLRHVANKIFHDGFIGVTFFFVLSGFILSHRYSRLASSISFVSFMRARIARIYPLHLFTLALAAILVLLKGDVWFRFFAGTGAANVALAQAFIPSSTWYFSLNAPSWSLSVEMFLYLLFPFLVNCRSIFLIQLTILVVALKVGLLVTDFGNQHFLQYVFPPLRLADFSLGILAHRLLSHTGAITRTAATSLQYAALTCLGVAMLFSSDIPEPWKYDLYYLAPMTGVIWAFAYNNGSPAKALSRPFFILLGEASFSLYMIHNLIISYGEIAGIRQFVDSDIASAVLYIVASLLASLAMYRYLELPAKQAALRLMGLRQRNTVVAATFTGTEEQQTTR